MSPSYSDFSQITELMEIKRLYEEQEEKFRMRLLQKDEEIESLRHDLQYRTSSTSEADAQVRAKDEEIQKLRGEYERLRTEAQSKINQLQERIKELNQRLMGQPPRK